MPPRKSIRLEAECDRSNERHTAPVRFVIYMDPEDEGLDIILGSKAEVYCPLCRERCDLESRQPGLTDAEHEDEREQYEQYIVDKAQQDRDD